MSEKEIRCALDEANAAIRQQFSSSGLHRGTDAHLPDRKAVIELLACLRAVMFPGYFSSGECEARTASADELNRAYSHLETQITRALCIADEESPVRRAQDLSLRFIRQLPQIHHMVMLDVQAAYDGDPAAGSREEVIFSYPGLFAVFVYRIAHALYQMDIPFIPRMMTEYAHSETGIDINPGATIGRYFFIDHGTGVVIGETTIIGDHVKIYQGVTLGALSTRSGHQLSGAKRHPTIENRVTIYSGASILGGETVIGEDSVIGGNAFITSSVPPHTKVSVKNPEHAFKSARPPENERDIWE